MGLDTTDPEGRHPFSVPHERNGDISPLTSRSVDSVVQACGPRIETGIAVDDSLARCHFSGGRRAVNRDLVAAGDRGDIIGIIAMNDLDVILEIDLVEETALGLEVPSDQTRDLIQKLVHVG